MATTVTNNQPALSPMSHAVAQLSLDMDVGSAPPFELKEDFRNFASVTSTEESLRQSFIFLNPPPSILCSICKEPYMTPLETPGGHVFCKTCIHTWLGREKRNTCPLSGQTLYIENLRPASRILSSVIDDMRVKCTACSKITTHGSIASHVTKVIGCLSSAGAYLLRRKSMLHVTCSVWLRLLLSILMNDVLFLLVRTVCLSARTSREQGCEASPFRHTDYKSHAAPTWDALYCLFITEYCRFTISREWLANMLSMFG